MTALRHPCPDKTRSDLEWDRILEALASRCASEAGRALARDLPFASSREETRALLAEAAEATDLLRDGEPLPEAPLADVSGALDRVGASGVLAGPEIREIAKALDAARALRRFLVARKSRLPALHGACSTDPTLDALADELGGCFDADGSLSDRASPRLKELRGEYQASRQRMLARLEDLMTRYEGILRDRFVTEREGRYVLPVRSDAHERFPGIVHGTSSSGGTLFLEPRAVIGMGNRMKVLEAEVEREEAAVYTRLSESIGDALPSVIAAVEALARADVRAASARLAVDARLAFAQVTDTPTIAMKNARHPMLVLEGGDVVPSDLGISARRALVVSGPNAGGKTVALKAMGLAALMVRAGLPVAADPGSAVGIFEVVLTDVGDDQSMTKSLSTFSAHVQNLAAILEDTHEGALVLLDELAGGTDPREGEALAAGMLDSLTARGGAVVVTTHYEGLKALALGDPRFENASMGFDIATMSPTFRLAMGIPGSSSALAVARRFGLPGIVIERAERFLTREDVQFETVVQKLHDERAATELARSAAEERERQAAELKAELERELRDQREREQRTLSKEAEELLRSVRAAREELRQAHARLRSKKLDAAGAREAERAIDRAAAKIAVGGSLEPLLGRDEAAPAQFVEEGQLKPGMRVYVARIRAEAEVLDLLPDGSVRVQAGAMKLTLPVSDLRAAAPRAQEPRRAGARDGGKPVAATAPLEVAIQTSDNTCDMRGMRTDDAVSMAISFLDRAVGTGLRVCFLVHGHGTGALKEAIRRELRSSKYVSHFRAGGPGEGGDGVTLAWLA
ncbi:MAG: endonuclease MutS2 [Polyangiaceae bacterium]